MHKVQYSFPQYRKYEGIDTWYKITGLDSFEEIVKMGEKYLHHTINATIYPEKLRILDMLECKDGLWVEIGEDDYMEILDRS